MGKSSGARRPEGNAVLQAVLSYLRGGVSVLPVALGGGKGPSFPDLPEVWDETDAKYKRKWEPYQSGLMSEREAERVWGRASPPGIGTVCGKISGNLELIDFDRDAATIFPAWRELVEAEAPGLFARLSVVRTPRGPEGYHLRYRVRDFEIPGNLPLARLAKSDEKDGKKRVLIETRGEGGYALAPGSPGACHETGGEYVSLWGPPPWEPPTITAEERSVLIEAARTFDRSGEDAPYGCKGAGQADLSPGDDYSLRGPGWDELLLPDGWTLARTDGGRCLWRRPGKLVSYSGTTGHCKGKDGADLLYVFSSSVHRLEPQKCYSKFSYLALVRHGGDFKACAAELRRGGYGAAAAYGPSGPAVPVSGFSGYRGIGVSGRACAVEPYVAFPVWALPPLLRAFVEEVAAAMGVDAAYVALPALAVLAAALGNSRSVWLKNSWPSEPSVLWTVLVGESGTAKSPPFDAAVAPAHLIDEELARAFEAQLLQFQQELEAWEAAASSGRGEKPRQPRQAHFVVEDVTIEGLAEILAASPRGVLAARDELAGWFRSFTKYSRKPGDSDEAPWLSMYGARRLKVNRKTGENRCLRVERAAVSVTGTVQPAILKRALGRDQFESGLAPRLLMGMPPKPRKRWTDADVSPATQGGYHRLVRRLADLALDDGQGGTGPLRLKLSPAAHEAWVAWYDEWADVQYNAAGDLAAAYSKLEAAAARLALIHHAAVEVGADRNVTRSVSRAAMEAGVVLARWFAGEARRVYAVLRESDEATDARRLAEWLQRQGGSATPNQLYKSNRSAYPSPEAAREALDALVRAGRARWEGTGGQPGRPTERCVLTDPSAARNPETPIPRYPDNPETGGSSPQ
jgi:hypothetical protein